MVSILAGPSNDRCAAEVAREVSRNWVFLGDSLTEGVGSSRVSYVNELVAQIRSINDFNVHELRLRHADPGGFVDFNVAGKMDVDVNHHSSDLWCWNLASEGQMIESDLAWLPLIATLRPELVVIFRGSLESIVRPAALQDGTWPWWVPASWRSYSAMDPRCYFSNTWWRKAKQQFLDNAKQRARLKLLGHGAGRPLIDAEHFTTHLATLLQRLRELKTQVLVLGLLPVDEACFPGSPAYFDFVNAKLKQIATREGVDFFDWGAELNSRTAVQKLFYRDGFHPNLDGARALAEILRPRLFPRA